ncbi:YitT family protein [Clostridium coskatii]|uniref:DUF2179 domain-containing protein n=1 Tax=Clostridium coskatii TaxID=1705578 RepID=A0A162JAP4_9CLOT|nr:YitT family protein [Clostridium coskatii]OAA92685.1 hypothetical protein WX73_00777 [Clostridium coskatii]OBR94611.1 hypothetical protein CLCOS_18500 [Clostridium coskatii]
MTKHNVWTNKSTMYQYIKQYLQMMIGCIIVAFGFNLFLKPNEIASGGTVGISILVQHVFGVEPAITQWCANIPLIFVGLFFMGKKFAMRTVFGSLVLPLCILFTTHFHALTLNPLLGAIYGGVLSGIGLGLVFKSDGSTGGTSIIASIANKYTALSIGNSQGLIDGSVIICAGFVFGAEKALYAIISIYITSKAIDLMQLGFSGSKVAFVISDRSQLIKKAVLEDLNRGVTVLSGFGGYTEEKRTVLMVVMDQSELNRFKTFIKNIDKDSFIIISDTHEVLGQGFKLYSGVKNKKIV